MATSAVSLIVFSVIIAVSSATTSTLVDDADETLYYTLHVLWDLVGVDDEAVVVHSSLAVSVV